MPKVTRPATARKPAPKKGPAFPIRKPKLVTAADVPNIAPINTGKVKAVYTRQGWLMWGIMGLCAVLGIFFSQQIIAAAQWVHLQASERAHAEIGQELCVMPLLTVQERDCDNCFSTEQDLLLQRYEAQARGFNEWRAERCLPLM